MREFSKKLIGNINALMNSYSPIYVIGVITIYAIIVTLVYWIVDLFTFSAGLRLTVAPAFRYLALTFGAAIIFSAWVASAATPPDRRLVLWRLFWFFAPPLLLLGIVFVAYVGFWAISDFQFWVFFIPILFVSILWQQVSNPILRSWMYRKAKDPECVLKAERRFGWPMSLEEWEDIEIQIAPEKYFGLLAGIGAVIFIILETIFGEFLERTFGSTGFLEASTVALFVGAIIYPLHTWTTKRLSIKRSRVLEDRSAVSLSKDLIDKTKKAYKILFSRFWYIWIFVVVIALFVGLTLLKYFPIL